MIEQWAKVRPDLDVSSIGVIARLARLRAIFDEELDAFFAEHVVTKPAFTMLVALVRIDQASGYPSVAWRTSSGSRRAP